MPEEAVQTLNGQTVVFVADDEPGTFVKREITVGPSIGDWAPVLTGLKEGEPVVTGGSFILKAQLGKAAEQD